MRKTKLNSFKTLAQTHAKTLLTVYVDRNRTLKIKFEDSDHSNYSPIEFRDF